MEILIEKGMGYEPVEARKVGKLEIGTIALDAIFTPVRKVSYRVENMRVGERTDFDKLILELETDGTLTPEEVFSQAADILVKHFSLFQEIFKKEEKPLAEAVAKKKAKEKPKSKKQKKAKKAVPKKHAKKEKRKKTK